MITNSRSPTKYKASKAKPGAPDLVGADRERGDRAGHRLTAFERVEGPERSAGRADRDRDDHRLPHRAREAQDQGGDDAGDGGGEDDLRRHGLAPGADPVCALAERARHRVHRVLGHRGDERGDEDPDRDPSRHEVEGAGRGEDLPHELRVDPLEREVSEDDARDARERLQDRLQRAAGPRGGVLGQVRGGAEAERRSRRTSRSPRSSACRRRSSRGRTRSPWGTIPPPIATRGRSPISQRIASPASARTIAMLISRLSAAAAKKAARTNRSLRRRRAIASHELQRDGLPGRRGRWPWLARAYPSAPSAVPRGRTPNRARPRVPIDPAYVVPVEPDSDSQVERVASIWSVGSSTYPV